jgi:hypothetical protein
MKTLALASFCFAMAISVGSAHAQRQDWRSCAVTICSNGECDGPNSNLIVVAPANFADPGFGGEPVMMRQLEALSERLYPAAQGWSHRVECPPKPGESYAMDQAKAYIQLAQAPPASREIKIVNPFDIWAYTPQGGPSVSAPATPSAEKLSPKVGAGTEKPDAGSTEPMNFIMWVDLREPINGVNSLCFHAIKTKPAPEGYRGKWPTLKNALPVIQSYFPLMLERCSKYGTPVSANVGFSTDDISPAAKRASMQADVERWRKQGFPEVYISN